MLRGLFFILYVATNWDAMIDLPHFDWDLAVFNTALLCLVPAVCVIRHLRQSAKTTPDRSIAS